MSGVRLDAVTMETKKAEGTMKEATTSQKKAEIKTAPPPKPAEIKAPPPPAVPAPPPARLELTKKEESQPPPAAPTAKKEEKKLPEAKTPVREFRAGSEEQAPERAGSAKKRARKQQFVPVEVEVRKAKICDERYAQQRDLFQMITKRNSSAVTAVDPGCKGVSSATTMKGQPMSEEDKAKLSPEIVVNDEGDANPGRQNHSMIVLKKEFFRSRSESKGKTVNLKMIVDGKDNEVLQLKFDYNLDSDTPESVAQEMVKALALSSTEVPRIEQAIREELSNCLRERTW